MKTIILSIASVFLLTNRVMAFPDMSSDKSVSSVFYYTNSIVFVENQIEFAVFPDGQFDFSFFGNSTRFTIGFSVNSFSFNAGFDYNPYIQYDAFGAVIQVENTPIFYDDYGRVSQIGNIGIRYNRFGRLITVGGLNVVTRNNLIVDCSGFINPFNRFYVYRPWHRYYVVPPVNYCVAYARPYRLNYRPVRHVYYRPYTNNTRYATNTSRRAYLSTGRINKNYSNRYKQVPRTIRDKQVGRDYKAGNYSRTAVQRSIENNRAISSRSTRTASMSRSNMRSSRANHTKRERPAASTNKSNNYNTERGNTSYATKRNNRVGKGRSYDKKTFNRSFKVKHKAAVETNGSRVTAKKNASNRRKGASMAKTNSRPSYTTRSLKTKTNSLKRRSRPAN